MESQAPNGRPHHEREYSPRYRTIRLHRSGNSLGIYVPRAIAHQLGWAAHDELKGYVVNRCFVLQAVARDSFTQGVVGVYPGPSPDPEPDPQE